jgi:pimeloyl-ACP methyl ester carboxylesterase
MAEVKYVDANGLRFAYLEEGAGPLVLLLHGFPDTAHTWDEVRPALSRAGYRAVSPFTRGYFPTAIPQDGKYDSATLGRDALALIAALSEKSAIVVGHDWGASAAYAAASLNPERVSLLITLAIPHPASILPTPRMMWALRHFLRLRLASAESYTQANNFAYVDELVQRWSPAWQVPPNETAAVKEVFRQPGSLTAAIGYYRALSPIVPAELRQPIAVPSVSFGGEQDSILQRKDFERAGRFFKGPYEIVMMPGGHFLHREHPARFIEELLRVLKNNVRESPR